MKVTSTTILDKHPETFRLEEGRNMTTPANYVAVVLPLSATAVEVQSKADGGEASTATWEPEAAMLVAAGTEFAVAAGSTHFVYVLVRMEAV